MALLLFRAVFAVSLLLEGRCYLTGAGPVVATRLLGLGALLAGGLLLIGFLTPIAGALVGFGGVGVALSLLPACTPTIFASTLATAFATTVLIGIIVLGPGAFSLDARLFGRREIIIPKSNFAPHREP